MTGWDCQRPPTYRENCSSRSILITPRVTPRRNAEFSHASLATTRGTLRIAETFTSRQGEGKLTGTESFFIRTSGCNLRCWFCDTPYASWNPKGAQLSFDSILQLVAESKLQARRVDRRRAAVAEGVGRTVSFASQAGIACDDRNRRHDRP